MARRVNQVLWDQWRQRLERQRASGLSIAEFCRKENVPPHRLYVWKRKFRHSKPARHAAGGATRAQHARKRRPIVTPRRRPGHVAARPASPAVPMRPANFLQLPVRGMRSSPWIELSLADGTLVRVPQENLAALTTLLKVLRGDNLDLLSGEAGHA
jgi:transposase-like protein